MVTFLGNPVSFTGKQLQVGDKALDFHLLQQTFLKNLWLILMERKKSWVSCLLSIQASAQLKRVVLMKNWLDWTTQSSWLFLWTYHCPKTLVWCWRHWKCHHALRLFRPFLWTWLCPLNQWVAPIGTRSFCPRYWQYYSLRWIRGQYQLWTKLRSRNCSC